MNELSTLAKFIYKTATSDPDMAANIKDRFYSEVIPAGESIISPALMFVTSPGRDTRGAFGIRLKTANTYQIKAVIEGSDFAPLEPAADNIDRLFDWQNQIDPLAGRPKSQQVYSDPNNSQKQIMIMSMKRIGNLRYAGLVDAVNYCHLGGEYEIEYYSVNDLQESSPIVPVLTNAQYLQQQIDALSQKESKLEMSFSNYNPTGVEPIIPVTTAAPIIAMPTVNTVYSVKPTANQIITLPAAPGIINGMAPVLHFDLQQLGGFTCAFALNSTLPDQYVPSTTATTTAQNIANAVAAGAASVSFRSLQPGFWSIE